MMFTQLALKPDGTRVHRLCSSLTFLTLVIMDTLIVVFTYLLTYLLTRKHKP